MNDELVIFIGDDTGGTFGRALQFTISVGEGVDLTGCSAEFIFDGITRTFPGPLVDGETREIVYTAEETAAMQKGVRYAAFRVIDASGKVRTFTNTVRVRCTDIVAEVYPGTSAITIAIGAVVMWSQISGIPKCEIEDVPAKYTMNTLAAKMNELLAWARTTFAAIALALLPFSADGALTVQTAPLGDIPSDSGVVTNVYMEGGTTGLSTNDVCAIVTNEAIAAWSDWAVIGDAKDVVTLIGQPTFVAGMNTWDVTLRDHDGNEQLWHDFEGDDWHIVRIVSASVDGFTNNLLVVIERSPVSYVNALGLARLVDLTSAKAEAIAAASNYTDAAIAAASAAQAATWSRPGDWVATATPRSVPVTAQNVNYVTNDATATITSNIVETVYYSLSADLDVEELDELSPVDAATASALGVTFEPTNGGVVTGNVFYATDAGLYRIRATSATRGSRYADCPLTAWQQVSSNAAVYIADAELPGKWRKGVNDAFLSDLNVSVHAATGVVDGASYDVWWTLRCPCRPISGHTVQGFRSRNALSPHLLIGARHYGYNGNASWLTFHDPVGNTNVAANTGGLASGATAYDDVTVPADYGFPLCWWALKHGWTRAELEAMNISDIAVYPIKDGATLPDPCIPYFASLDTLRTRFGGKGNIGGWAFSQTYVGRTGPDGIAAGNYMTPAIINIGNLDTATYGACTWTCAGYTWGASVRADILARWRTMREVEGGAGSFPPIYGGDSSGGIYFKDADGRWIMVSMFTTIGSGPSLSAAVPVLRALCAEYGDTLKEVE